MNKVIIIGRLGVDPELKYTPSGKAVANFSVATSERWTDKDGNKQEKTEWHRVVVWGKLAELCNQYLSKGRQAVVEGSLQTRSWDAQDGSKKYTTEIIGKNVEFLGGNGGSQSNAGGSDEDYSPSNQQDFTADDIPF